MDHPETVVGERLGAPFPTSIEALLARGPAFLTDAMRAAGTLPADNRVTEVVASREFFGGGMGRKLTLDVAYARADPSLHTELFAKFPRDFGDPLRPLFAPLMQPEVSFALLSRAPRFPVITPRCYFADYDPATTSGLLITERVAYGRDGVESCHPKCLDHLLGDPLPYYRELTRAMARLAAAHRAGRLGPEADRLFLFDPDTADAGARIPYTPAELAAKLDALTAFAAAAPQLFEPRLLEGDALRRFVAEAPLVLEHEAALRAELHRADDLIALCHWNMNLDNAWFRRDADGGLHVGLLDWGSVGPMNLAQSFFGMTCAAETGFLDAHRSTLMELLAAEYAAQGGPEVPLRRLARMVALAVALLGVAWILDAPAIIAREIPDYASLSGRDDPRLRDNFLARCQLQILMVFLNEWRGCRSAEALRSLAA